MNDCHTECGLPQAEPSSFSHPDIFFYYTWNSLKNLHCNILLNWSISYIKEIFLSYSLILKSNEAKSQLTLGYLTFNTARDVCSQVQVSCWRYNIFWTHRCHQLSYSYIHTFQEWHWSYVLLKLSKTRSWGYDLKWTP